MKRTMFLLAVVMILALVQMGYSDSANAQSLMSTEGKVRLFKGGLTIEGKDLQVNGESVSLTVGEQVTFMDLMDIDRVDIRKSNVMKGACIGGGGCLAIALLACSSADDSDLSDAGGDRGDCYAGSMIWSGLFAAGGALIGNMNSKWNTVYYRTGARLDSKSDLRYASSTQKKPRFRLAIIPPRDCCTPSWR